MLYYKVFVSYRCPRYNHWIYVTDYCETLQEVGAWESKVKRLGGTFSCNISEKVKIGQ